tara:strand:+ start:2405 stop:3067 length:663 start_codon:yes stop_codon:yes gene_type:complete
VQERNFEATVFDFLVFEKAFPHADIQMEAVIGAGAAGDRYRADLAILDSKRNEIICLIEAKKSREHRSLRLAVGQLMQYRRVLNKPYTPLYLFFPPLEGSGKKFDISQILPDGEIKEIYPDEFPSYDALVSIDRSNKKAARAAAVRTTFDSFKVTCIALSIAAAILFGLDVFNILQLSVKQLTLAAISGALLILPFAAKFKMLGIEFERHNQAANNASEP